jgi:hypothetical protein
MLLNQYFKVFKTFCKIILKLFKLLKPYTGLPVLPDFFCRYNTGIGLAQYQYFDI